MKRVHKTWGAARAAVLAHLSSLHGWEVHTTAHGLRDLKVPWAKTPNGSRVEFHPQAVHLGVHSLFMDLREHTPEDFVSTVLAVESRRLRGHEAGR